MQSISVMHHTEIQKQRGHFGFREEVVFFPLFKMINLQTVLGKLNPKPLLVLPDVLQRNFMTTFIFQFEVGGNVDEDGGFAVVEVVLGVIDDEISEFFELVLMVDYGGISCGLEIVF